MGYGENTPQWQSTCIHCMALHASMSNLTCKVLQPIFPILRMQKLLSIPKSFLIMTYTCYSDQKYHNQRALHIGIILIIQHLILSYHNFCKYHLWILYIFKNPWTPKLSHFAKARVLMVCPTGKDCVVGLQCVQSIWLWPDCPVMQTILLYHYHSLLSACWASTSH